MIRAKDKPKKKEKCTGDPIIVAASIPIRPTGIIGLFWGIDIAYTKFMDGSSTLYVGGGVVGGTGSGRRARWSGPSASWPQSGFGTAAESPRGFGLFASVASHYSAFFTGVSGSIFGNGSQTDASATISHGLGHSLSVTAGYRGQSEEIHRSCQ